jgi:hypothetical protein
VDRPRLVRLRAGGLIVWIISKVAGSTAPYEPSVRIAAYSYVVAPVAAACLFLRWIGWIGAVVVVLYGIFIAVTGAKVLNFEAPPPAPVPPA